MQSLPLLVGELPQLRGRPRIKPRLSETSSLNALLEGRSEYDSRIVVVSSVKLTGHGVAPVAGAYRRRCKALTVREA